MTLRQLRALLSEAEARLGPNAPAYLSPDGSNVFALTLRVAHPDHPGALLLAPLEAAVPQAPRSVRATPDEGGAATLAPCSIPLVGTKT